MRKVYLDNAATAPMDPAVITARHDVDRSVFGNPSSIHYFGQTSKVHLEQSRKIVAESIGAQPDQIIFTGGGTESDNLAVIGTALANRDRGSHIITTEIEHPAVLESMRYLTRIGFSISYLKCDKKGKFKISDLEALIRDDTILLSAMMVNNETGCVLPLHEFSAIVRAKGIIFHSDAVQGFGKLDLNVSDLNLDLVSLSAHKIHGPKGVGSLYVRKGILIDRIIHGGSQEVNRRAGTENLAGIVGFAAAIKQMDVYRAEQSKVKDWRDNFEKQLKQLNRGILINGEGTERVGTISNVYFPQLPADTMLINLDMAGIAASAGSACSSGSTRASHVLSAMGLSKERVKNSIRFSFSRFNSMEDINYTIMTIREIYNRLEISHGHDG